MWYYVCWKYKKTYCNADCVCPELRERESKAPGAKKSFSLHPPCWLADMIWTATKANMVYLYWIRDSGGKNVFTILKLVFGEVLNLIMVKSYISRARSPPLLRTKPLHACGPPATATRWPATARRRRLPLHCGIRSTPLTRQQLPPTRRRTAGRRRLQLLASPRPPPRAPPPPNSQIPNHLIRFFFFKLAGGQGSLVIGPLG